MTLSFTKKNLWALSVLSLACIIVISISFYLFNKLVQASYRANHSMEVLGEAQQSLICLLDCETAYRGYLLTANKVFLEPYENCYDHVFEHLQREKTLCSDNPIQLKRMDRLIVLGKEKVEFTQRAIDWRNSHTGVAANEVPLLQGKALMDEFRRDITEVQDEEYHLLAQRELDVQNSRIAFLVAISISSSIIMLTIIWMGMSNRRYVREQNVVAADLNNARDEAIQANKLKSQFVANISHEIRTPLSGILGLSELLTNYDLEPEEAELVGHIYTSSQSLVGLINEILDFSRLEAGRIELSFTSLYLPDVVNLAVTSVMVQAESKKLLLDTKIEDELAPMKLCGDSNRVRQVLLNLLHNAIKFTAQGNVQLSITKERIDGKTIYVRFQVSDTGIGIDETQKRQLFEPFVQADGSTTRKYGGTGLGLSICLSLVHLMRGTIDCFKNEKGGATFWFILPFEFGDDTACTREAQAQALA